MSGPAAGLSAPAQRQAALAETAGAPPSSGNAGLTTPQAPRALVVVRPGREPGAPVTSPISPPLVQRTPRQPRRPAANHPWRQPAVLRRPTGVAASSAKS